MTPPLVFPADEWELVRALHRLLVGDPPALPEPAGSTEVRESAVGLAAVAVPGHGSRYAFLVRLTTRPLEADAEPWDPADPGPFKAIAGDQFLGADGDLALVRMRNGCVMHLHPGWVALRPDGPAGGEALFVTPESLEVTWQAA